MNTSISDDFNQALVAQGVHYLALENKLRDEIAPDPQKAAQALAHLAKAEPIGQLMTTVLLGWVGKDKSDFIEALDYLDTIGPKVRRSAIGFPPPSGVANHALLRFAMGARRPEWRHDALEAVKEIGDPKPGRQVGLQRPRRKRPGNEFFHLD
jgi:hypothetical protein